MRRPLPPPPEDAVRLWIAWQAAIEYTAEMKHKHPPVEESVVGGIALPLLTRPVVDAMNAEVEASIAFHQHPWWYNAQNGAEADRAIAEAAERLKQGL